MTDHKFNKVTTLITIALAVPGAIAAGIGLYVYFVDSSNDTPSFDSINQKSDQHSTAVGVSELKQIRKSNKSLISPQSDPIQKIHDNVITVKGIGILDTSIKNDAQRVYLGKRAARADAKRQITEILETSVVGGTDVQNGILSKEETTTKVRSILRYATVVSDRELSDGTIEVTMTAPLNQQ